MFQVRAGVVVAAGVDVVDEVVGVGGGDGARQVVVHVLLGRFAGGGVLLHLQRARAHDEDHLVGGRRPWTGSVVYSPSFQAGSRSMASMAM